MNLDGNQIAIGDDIFHLQFGAGRVTHTALASVQANFSGQIITISEGNLERNGVKMVGRGQPLVVWPARGEDVARLAGVVEEARKL